LKNVVTLYFLSFFHKTPVILLCGKYNIKERGFCQRVHEMLKLVHEWKKINYTD
jgi:hypothetical protein